MAEGSGRGFWLGDVVIYYLAIYDLLLRREVGWRSVLFVRSLVRRKIFFGNDCGIRKYT